MTIHVKNQRKAVQIGWSTDVIKGKWATIEGLEAGSLEEKLHVPNDGDALVSYGKDFSGTSTLRVSGSKGGVEEGTITVH